MKIKAAALFLLYLLSLIHILDMLEESSKASLVFRKGIKAFVVACVSVVVYTVISRMIYPQLDAYNGLDQMGKLDLIRLPRLILRSYKWVAEYFILKPFSFISGTAWVLNVVSVSYTHLSWYSL